MHEVLVNRLGGLSLPRKSVVRLTDRPDMTLDVYRGRKTTIQYCHCPQNGKVWFYNVDVFPKDIDIVANSVDPNEIARFRSIPAG